MAKIRFIKSKAENEIKFKQVTPHVIDITLKKKAATAELTGGFDVINEYNDTVMGTYRHSTIYRKIDDLHYQLSDDGSTYEEPVEEVKEATITFVGTEHLTPSFTKVSVEVGTDLSQVTFPEIISDNADYSLSDWTKTSGKITGNTVIVAIEVFEHTQTLEEAREIKIAELAATCEQMIVAGVDVEIGDEIEHFSYTNEDQANIDDLVNMVTSTGLDQPYHADNKICKLYTPAQIFAIYSAEKVNKTHHITYNNSLKACILDLDTKEAIEAVEYGQNLTGKYLENYNAMMAQAKAITEAVLAKMAV